MAKEIKPIDIIEADNVHIAYIPEVKTSGKKSPQSYSLDFHTSEGWVRIKLEGDVCDLFDERYEAIFEPRSE
jgi:hypothetical protein